MLTRKMVAHLRRDLKAGHVGAVSGNDLLMHSHEEARDLIGRLREELRRVGCFVRSDARMAWPDAALLAEAAKWTE